MDKKDLRKIIRDRKRQYSSSTLEELSLSVLSHLEENGHLQSAHTVMMYYSLPDEVNTHRFIDSLVACGKKVLLPEVIDDRNMVLREYSGRADLREGAYHIMEPAGTLFPPHRYNEIDVAIIPGMAFDTQGNRLGRGKAYYDRFLPKIPGAYRIGIAFPFQLLPQIPTEETDIAMNEIVS